MAYRLILALLLCLTSVGQSTEAFAASSEDKATFKLFDGAWDITEGPLVGFRLLLGDSGRSGKSTFALVVPNTTGFLRLGEITLSKNDKIKGKFKRGSLPAGVTDPATLAGLTEGGKFSLSIVPSSIYKITGNLTGSNKQSFSLTAVAEELTFHTAKFVLQIEATKKKQFKVGESVTFDITAELRGPAGVIPEQPELQIALDGAVQEISVKTIKNLTACTVNTARSPNQVACSFAPLGPKQTEARLQVTATVPEELAGKRLQAAVGVDDTPGYDPTIPLNPIIPSAATRKASVKIKKGSISSGCESKVVGVWVTNFNSVLTFFANRQYESLFNGVTTPGVWRCSVEAGVTKLELGSDEDPPSFGDPFTFTDDTHFFGAGAFGQTIRACKNASTCP